MEIFTSTETMVTKVSLKPLSMSTDQEWMRWIFFPLKCLNVSCQQISVYNSTTPKFIVSFNNVFKKRKSIFDMVKFNRHRKGVFLYITEFGRFPVQNSLMDLPHLGQIRVEVTWTETQLFITYQITNRTFISDSS